MFGIDFDEILRGYSDSEEMVARDLLILDLLKKKGILTQEEIDEQFDRLSDVIKAVHEKRKEIIAKRIDELKEKSKDKGVGDNDE